MEKPYDRVLCLSVSIILILMVMFAYGAFAGGKRFNGIDCQFLTPPTKPKALKKFLAREDMLREKGLREVRCTCTISRPISTDTPRWQVTERVKDGKGGRKIVEIAVRDSWEIVTTLSYNSRIVTVYFQDRHTGRNLQMSITLHLQRTPPVDPLTNFIKENAE